MSNSLMRDPASSVRGGERKWGGLMSPLLPVILATVGCSPLLIVHFQQLWSRPHYQYFPLVIVSVVVVYQLRRTDPDQVTARPRPLFAGLALLAGLALATYAVLQISPLLCCAAWLLATLAFVARSPVPSWSCWALLCLLLRLPQGRDVQLIQWLQHITTRISSGVLDQLQIDHIQAGNVLSFPDHTLFVEEACSGVVSLFTILATAAIFGVFLRRSAFHTILLMVAGAFWAGAANILRVVLIAVFLDKLGMDLTKGWPHDILGLAVFCITLVILFSTDALLRFVAGPIEIETSGSPESLYENRLVGLWNVLLWPTHERPVDFMNARPPVTTAPLGTAGVLYMGVVSVGFLLLGALQIWGGIGPFSTSLGIGSTVDALAKDSLSPQVEKWTLDSFRRESRSATSEFGERSRQWIYRQGDMTAVVSMDYPFPEWHDVSACYRGIGWTSGKQLRLLDGTTAQQYPLQNDQNSAWLIFDLFDQHGAPYQSPTGQGIHPRWRRLLSGESSRWALPTYYQVQVLVVIPSTQPVPPPTVLEIQRLFSACREQIRQQATHKPNGDHP